MAARKSKEMKYIFCHLVNECSSYQQVTKTVLCHYIACVSRAAGTVIPVLPRLITLEPMVVVVSAMG